MIQNKYILIIVCFCLFLLNQIQGQGLHNEFVGNKNQWPEQVKFAVDVPDGKLFLEKNCLTYSFYDSRNLRHSHAHHHGSHEHEIRKKRAIREPDFTVDCHAYRVVFENCNQDVNITGYEPVKGIYNFYQSDETENWASGVKAYKYIIYKNIYDHIDLKVYFSSSGLKYDFMLKPKSRIDDIQLRFTGPDSVNLDQNQLKISTSVNIITESSPVSYQLKGRKKDNVRCQYKLKENILSFELPQGYDKARELIIDPSIIFSTYSGSTADNWGFTGTFDSKGNGFSGGIVFDVGYPVSEGAYQQQFDQMVDVGIIKYNQDGTERIYATYLGGRGSEMPHSLIVNEFDELLIFGTTGSNDFPVSENAYDTTYNGGENLNYVGIQFSNGTDIFISKLSKDGQQLLASTYVGGSRNDGLNFRSGLNEYYGNGGLYYNYGDGARGEIITDDQNNVYIGTCTFSDNFPVKGTSLQTTKGGKIDGVIFKLDYNLSNLIWSTYLGGSDDDAIYSVDVDKNYDLAVAGGTMSNSTNITQLFPITQDIWQSEPPGGNVDAFLAKISGDGRNLIASTFFGSDAYDQAYFVRSDKYNNLYIFGQTEAPDSTLIFNAPYSIPNSGQFLAKFEPDLKNLVWSTVFGTGNGKANISPTAFSVDICQRIYLSGSGREWPTEDFVRDTIDPDFYYSYYLWDSIEGTKGMEVTPDAFQKETDGKDFYILVLEPEVQGIDYATFLGEVYDGGRTIWKVVEENTVTFHGTEGCPYSGHDHVDGGTSRFDKIGNIYQSVCGSCGGCQLFPTTQDVWSNTNNSSNCNNALVKFNIHTDILIADFESPHAGCAPFTVDFDNTSSLVDPEMVEFKWDFDDGNKSKEKNPVHTFTQPGQFNVKLVVNDLTSCNLTDTIMKEILVLSNTTYDLPDIHLCAGFDTIIGIQPKDDPQISYSWYPAEGLSDPTIPNPYASPLTTKTYLLTVTNGICTDSIYQEIFVDSVTAKINQVKNNPCFDDCKGRIAISANGTAPLNYLWNTGENTPEITELCNGEYSVTITDKYGCSDELSAHIESPPELQIQLEDTIAGDCFDTLSMRIVPVITGGVKPYDYHWDDGTTDSVLHQPVEGWQGLTVTDDNGCSARDSFFYIDNSDFEIEILSIDSASCFGECDGAVIVTAKNGGGDFQYKLGDMEYQNDGYFDRLCAGQYRLSVKNSGGCTKNKIININQPDEIEGSAIEINNATCNKCNGSATISVSGGNPPNEIIWPDGSTGLKGTNLCPGVKNIIITDSEGCVLEFPIQIDEIPDFSATITETKSIDCFGHCHGELTLAIEGNFPPFKIEWLHSGESSKILQDLCADTYSVKITDNNNCIDTISYTLNQPERLNHALSVVSDIPCFGEKATVVASISGGTPPYTVNWPENQESYVDSALISAGNYAISVVDMNGCTDTTDLIINEPQPIQTSAIVQHEKCFGACNGFIEIIPTGGISPYTYSFDSGSYTEINRLENLCAGNYSISVMDANDCLYDTTITIQNLEQYPEIQIHTEKQEIFPGQHVQLSVEGVYAAYSWMPAGALDNPASPQPVATLDETTTFSVNVTDEFGCEGSDTLTVFVREGTCGEPYIYVPNAFTPGHNDYQNDVLYVRSNVIEELHFKVFNRWGEIVFETRNIDSGWDGTYKGKLVDPAVFVYFLEATCYDGQKFVKKGNITVIR